MHLPEEEPADSIQKKALEFRNRFSKTLKRPSLDSLEEGNDHEDKVESPKQILNRAVQNFKDPFLSEKFFQFLAQTGKSSNKEHPIAR